MSSPSAAAVPVSSSAWLDVWIVAITQVVSGIGAYAALTTLILALQDAGAGGLAVAGVTIAASLPVVALAPVTGRLADRFDSRLLLVVAGAIQIAGCLLLSVAQATPVRIAYVALIYCGTALSLPVRQALLPAMVTDEDLPHAGAINQSAAVVGAMIGPPVAGFAYHAAGSVPGTLRWASVGFLATIIAGFLVRTRRGNRTAEQQAAAVAPREATDPLLKVVFIGIAAVVAAISAVDVVAVFFVRDTLAASAQTYGVLVAMWPIGMVAGAWAQAKVASKASDRKLAIWLFLTLAITSGGVVLLAAVRTPLWFAPIWLIGGLLNGAANVLVTTLVARRSPVEVRGRIAAVMQAAVQGALLAGYVASGLALTSHATPRQIILVCGIVAVLTVAGIFPWVRAQAQRLTAGAIPAARVTEPLLTEKATQPQE